MGNLINPNESQQNAIMQFIGGYLPKVQEQQNSHKMLGNILMSGTPNEGQAIFIKTLLTQALREKKSMVIFTNKNSPLHSGLQAFQREVTGLKEIWNLDFTDDGRSDAIDPFANLTTVEIKEFIMDILKKFRPLTEPESVNIGRYVNTIVKALDTTGKPIRLNEFIDYGDPREAGELLNQSGFSERELQRTERFIKSFEHVVLYETLFEMLNESGLGDIFSGEATILDIVKGRNILVITVEQSINKESSEATIQLLLKLLLKNMGDLQADEGAFIVFDGIHIQNMELFNNILQLNQNYDISSVFTVEDVSEQTKLSGNQFLDRCRTFAIFTQSSNANCQYWSDFCGYQETTQVSYSYSSQENRKPSSPFGPSGFVQRKDYQLSNMGMSKQLKPIYSPEIFRGLKEKEVILFSKAVNKKRKLSL